MNKWNRLLAALDEVYGFQDKKNSEYRKVGQHFDERTNEHVVVIEYRARRGVSRSPQRVTKVTENEYSLLKEINSALKLGKHGDR